MQGVPVKRYRVESLDGPRASHPDEFPDIMRMLDEVFWISKGKPPCMQRLYPWLNRLENYEHFFIYRTKERIVSHVSMNWLDVFCGAGKVRVGLVGGVATLPEYRGMGFAGNLLKLVLGHMRADGCEIAVLWATGKNLYEKAGFYECGVSYTGILERKTFEDLKPAEGEIMHYHEFKEYSKDMVALHESGPAQSIRPFDEFPQHIEYDFGTTRLLVRDKRCAAYLATRALFDGEPYVTEWAGKPTDIFTLIKARLEELDMDKISISLPAWETDFSQALRGMAVDLEINSLHGPCMICVLSPDFWECAEKKGYGGSAVRGLVVNSETVPGKRIEEAHRSVFGTVECRDETMPFYIWRPDII